MNLGLGLGLSSRQSRPAISGQIPPVDPPGGGGDPLPPGDFDGFETPPTVVVIADSVVIHGKIKPGFIGKFVVPLGTLQVDKAYNVNVDADFSQLTLGGSKAGVGYGFKTDNRFRLELLQGNGSSTRVTTTRGQPPNGWNKQTGHTVTDGGAPENGTQHSADIQLIIDGEGDGYSFSTSGDNQETWDEELVDQPLTPFSNITAVEQFGIAGWFSSDDTGPFTITVTWTEGEAAADLWTPAELGADVIGWWDPSDAANVTLTGALVDRITNLAAGNLHFDGLTTARPTRETVADFGGLNAVKFDNSNDILTTSTLITRAQPVTFCGLYRTGASIDDLDFYIGAGGCQISMKWSGVSDKPHSFCGSAVARTNTVLSTSTTYIDITLLSGAASYTRLNGNAADPVTFNPGTTGFAAESITLGLAGGRSCFAGHFAEIVMVNRALTSDEYQKMEGYLAHKWGRTANLPGGHPYKTNPPTV